MTTPYLDEAEQPRAPVCQIIVRIEKNGDLPRIAFLCRRPSVAYNAERERWVCADHSEQPALFATGQREE